MRVSRLYLDTAFSEGLQLELDENSAHYVRTVLRLKKNTALQVFNGHGGAWQAQLLEVHKKRVLLEIGTWQAGDSESHLSIQLGLVIVRSERMDWAIQKSVELGVSAITPLFSERCVVQLKAEKLAHRLGHWQRIVQHASEQCGRNVLPPVAEPMQLFDWLKQQSGSCIFFDPHADNTLTSISQPSTTVTLLAGPEGGFSEQERDSVKHSGFMPVKFGPRILRAETAAMAAVTAVQTLWGDFT